MQPFTMSRITAMLFFVALVEGCQSQANSSQKTDASSNTTRDQPRNFDAQIVSLRPTTSLMMFVVGAVHGTPDQMNLVAGHYTRDTKIFVDGRPAALDEIHQYMRVKVRARLTHPDGPDQPAVLVIDMARFTSGVLYNTTPATAPKP